MKYSKQFLAGALAFFLAGPVLAFNTQCANLGEHVKSRELEFGLYHSQIPGQLATTTHSLRVSGTQYKLQSVSQAQGMLALLYSGNLKQESERQFFQNRRGFLPCITPSNAAKKPLAESVLHTDSREIEFKKNHTQTAWQQNLQDRLSMIYQISALLACQQPTPQPDDAFTLPILSTGRLETETFALKGTEK
ncbi:MAG: DUF3108 domain-containing protein [Limnobacter sp.]|nr:DUF3108 domain-containing protein [Limnobacter sp.]